MVINTFLARRNSSIGQETMPKHDEKRQGRTYEKTSAQRAKDLDILKKMERNEP